MADEDDLLQAIADDPNDDGPRLAYADWLEERGDPRSEFIRLQCDVARMPLPDATLNRERRLRELGLPGYPQGFGRSTRCRFNRGFVEAVFVWSDDDLRLFVSHAREVLRPWLVRDFASVAPEFVGPQFYSPSYAGRGYRYQPGGVPTEDTVVRSLVRLPQLALLRRLSLWGIGTASAQAVAASPHLTGLASLSLASDLGIEPAAVRALLESDYLGRVAELDLSGRREIVGRTVTVTPFEESDVTIHDITVHPNVGLAGVRALAASPGASRLRTLDLSYNDIGDAGTQALLDSPHLTHLAKLTLSDETIGVAAREALWARFGYTGPSPKGTALIGFW